MSKILEVINTWIFSKLNFNPLGILRISLLSYLLFIQHDEFFNIASWFSASPIEFSTFKWMFLANFLPIPFPQEYWELFSLITYQLGLFALLGILTRYTLALYTFCYVYVAAYQSVWGWHDHGPSLVAQILIVMIVSPGIKSLSLDLLWSFYRDYKRVNKHELKIAMFKSAIFNHNVSGWGLNLIIILISAFYFTSGVSKIRYGGFDWLNGETLSYYLSEPRLSNQQQTFGSTRNVTLEEKWKDNIGLEYYHYGSNPPEFIRDLANNKNLMSVLSISAVLLEIFYPLVLISKKLRLPIFLSASAFHTCIYFTMGISFFSWVVVDLVLAGYSLLDRRLQPAK